jgi:drug/metabolite transporter (DMT)-like permease
VRIGASALIPGLIAILLFYRGLRGTKACYAVLAEFMYPTAALVGNWIVLGAMITPLQGFGCLLLIATVLLLAWQPSLAPAPVSTLGHVGRDERALAFAESA